MRSASSCLSFCPSLLFANPESMNFQRISIDPNICEGKATVKGTRMTVEFVLKLMGSGYTAADVVHEYPDVEIEDVYECAKFGAWLASDNTVSVG